MAVVMRHGVKIHDEVQCGMGNVVGLFVGPYQHWGVMRMNMEKDSDMEAGNYHSAISDPTYWRSRDI